MPVTCEKRGDIAVVTIDNPPVNAINRAVREALIALVADLDADPAIAAVVLTGSSALFVGGADIREFDRPLEEPHLPDLLNRIEDAAKPWIAAIRGAAIGGGLELALACRFRLAAPDADFSLPEVNLGLIPGAGGTQRLPRLIGADAAIGVIAENRRLSGREAVHAGLVDRCVAGNLLAAACAFARQAVKRPLPPRIRDRSVQSLDPAVWGAAEVRIRRQARGSIAPILALAALHFGVEQGFADGIVNERRIFLELRDSEQAAALRRLFFAERAVGRPAALKHIPILPLGRIGVIGAGTMGVGIAAALRNAGHDVVLAERDEVVLARGLQSLRAIFALAERKAGSGGEGLAEKRMAGVEGTVGLEGLARCDLVIEAVFEDVDIKREVFAELDGICMPGTIFATNTSYIDPRAIAEVVGDPGRFIGLHFFSPAHVMKLLEIIPLPQTRPDVLATGFALAQKLGKVPVQSGICEGFIGNRIVRRYRAEAEAMLTEGVPYKQIDAAMRSFGFAMGPFEMQDLAGLDIAYLQREAARARGETVSESFVEALVRQGRKGQKSGGGWYDYVEGDRTAHPSRAAEAIIAPLAGGAIDVPPEQIASRLVTAMSEEGAAILAEGIAGSSTDIDLVEVHGYGFPRWRGGPMFIAARAAQGR